MSNFAILLIIFSIVFFLKLSKVLKVSWWIIILWAVICVLATLIYYDVIKPSSVYPKGF